jgi:hypothetical protein
MPKAPPEKMPAEILALFKKRHANTIRLHPSISRWYPDTPEGLEEHMRIACEEYGNLNCEIQDGKSILKDGIEDRAKFHGMTYEEEYKIFVYCNRGTIYEAKRTPLKYKVRGALYPIVLDISKEPKYKYYIENLHQNTILVLYHGSSCKTAYNAVTVGVDLNTTPCHEVYPEIVTVGGKMVGRYRQPGIYVTPFYDTASTFAGTDCVIEFIKSARHLYPPPSFEYEFEAKGIDIDDKYQEMYPNSFRPSVSYWMLARESQAFLKQSIEPNEVFAIWEYDYALKKRIRKTPDEFKATFRHCR